MSFSFRTVWALPLVVAGLALVGCGQEKAAETGPPKPVIAVSIFPVASLVQQLTDDWAEVVTLLPEGAEEHDFEMTADQVRQLSRADLLVLVGNGLDTWAELKPGTTAGAKQLAVLRMGDLLKDFKADNSAKQMPVASKPSVAPAAPANAIPPASGPAAASENLAAADTRPDSATRLGPPPPPVPDAAASAAPNNHLWLDPVLVARFVQAIAHPLCERYPEHRAEIEKAASRLLDDVQRIDQNYRHELSMVRRRELVTFHNAFDLIANRYGLLIVARLTDIEADPHGGVPPDAYLGAIKAIKKYGLMVIYSEPEFSAQEVAGIRRETGVELLTLDPLGGPKIDGYRTYQEMMESNLKTLVRGQGLDTPGPELPVPVLPDTARRTRSTDPDFDVPLHIPSGEKKQKKSGRPDLLSDPDLRFPPIVAPRIEPSGSGDSNPAFPHSQP